MQARSLLLLLALTGLGSLACSSAPEPPEARRTSIREALERAVAEAPRLHRSEVLAEGQVLQAEAPPDWILEPDARPYRLFVFRLPARSPLPEGALPGSGDAELVVDWFGPGAGGSVEENLRAWAASIEPPEGDGWRAADLGTVGAPGSLLTRLQVDGRFLGEPVLPRPRLPAPEEGGETPPEERSAWSLDAGVLETPLGSFFVRAVGPREALRRHRGDLDRFYGSLRLAGRP